MSGSLTFAEFLEPAIDYESLLTKECSYRCFRLLDLTNSGFVTVKEMNAMLFVGGLE